jgi:hypothetical protein
MISTPPQGGFFCEESGINRIVGDSNLQKSSSYLELEVIYGYRSHPRS